MMAGYEVEGLVEDGNMETIVLPTGADIHEVVRSIVASPYGRANFLGAESNRVAVSSLIEPEGSAAVFAFSYRWPIDLADADTAAVQARIDAARKAAGAPAIRWDPGYARLCLESSKKVAGQTADSSDAIDALRDLAKQHYLYGLSVPVAYTRPEKLKLDETLLDPSVTKAGIATFYIRPTREPWAHRVAMFFFPAGNRAGGNRASHRRPRTAVEPTNY